MNSLQIYICIVVGGLCLLGVWSLFWASGSDKPKE